jgi:mannose-6-phosphate isomerase-like protein (cupin superfamily)
MEMNVSHPDDVPGIELSGDTCVVRELIASHSFAESMGSRLFTFGRGVSSQKVDTANDTFIYAVDGAGTIEIAGTEGVWREPMARDSASLVRAGDSWRVEVETELAVSATTVPVPPGPFSSSIARDARDWRPIVHVSDVERGLATANREFEVLYDDTRGSRMATLFVGHVPPLTGSQHYHLYDELCVVLRGSGELTCGDDSVTLRRGSTFSLPARLLHQVRNTSATEELCLLGIFRPTGSPAAAFLPDGVPAPI